MNSYIRTDRLSTFLDTQRISGDADTYDDLVEAVEEAEWASGELAVIGTAAAMARLNEMDGVEGPDAFDPEKLPGTIEKALVLLTQLRAVCDQNERVALFDDDGLAEFGKLLKRYDELEVFRMLVLSAVKKTGALAIDAQPDDNGIVNYLKALLQW